jgi:hypothetical protein
MLTFESKNWPKTYREIISIVGEDLIWDFDRVNVYEEEKQAFVVLAAGGDEHEAFYQGGPIAIIKFPFELWAKVHRP